jgi:NAD(P)H-hydrate epimerase
MNIFYRSQIQAWDRYTIANEPIESIDLMERASGKICDWLLKRFSNASSRFLCICGTGNNGGDGFALSRMLLNHGYTLEIYISEQGNFSDDCLRNYTRLTDSGFEIKKITGQNDFPLPDEEVIIIDALYGTGLSRPVEGLNALLINHINELPNKVISIDMPSGLPADGLAANDVVVRANHTLTFQVPKFSFFLPEHEMFTGEWDVLDIGLHQGFLQIERTPYQWIDQNDVQYWLPAERSKFAHKGNFGHALLMGGSLGMMGAMIMAAKACLRSGVGLCTIGVQDEGIPVLQTAVPEAMCGSQSQWLQHSFYAGKTAVGCGMGWVADDYHSKLLQWLICNVSVPLLIDATGLNLLAQNPKLLEQRTPECATIITPHIGEFNRLTGKSNSSVERLDKAKQFASQYNVFVVLKGAYTQIITPGGLVYFNSTGNPGMAKGGSGDVLAGLITGLLAQGNIPSVACLLGVYLHGFAGDLSSRALSQPGMTPLDIIRFLPKAWKKLYRSKAIIEKGTYR